MPFLLAPSSPYIKWSAARNDFDVDDRYETSFQYAEAGLRSDLKTTLVAVRAESVDMNLPSDPSARAIRSSWKYLTNAPDDYVSGVFWDRFHDPVARSEGDPTKKFDSIASLVRESDDTAAARSRWWLVSMDTYDRLLGQTDLMAMCDIGHGANTPGSGVDSVVRTAATSFSRRTTTL
jgi:hypothetical protein